MLRASTPVLLAALAGLAAAAAGQDPAASNDTELLHPDQLVLQQRVGVGLLGDMYVSAPVVSPLLVTPVDSPSTPSPSFSTVYSFFEVAQKGTSALKRGVWFSHKTVTLVLSYHYGCPVQIYKIRDGKLTTELLGNPLENAEFRPTLVLWAGDLQTVESLCEDMFTFVSYVSVTAWTLDGRESWDAEQMVSKFPLYADEFRRLASAEFNADQSSLSPEVYNGDWAPQ
ncbi:uncharacterized protein LOC119111776 [Pollicipes pollicipes]|uniref:uncharacterized protein LOC119111776 n=1 Tax=Pollicipes pollicipes TaxID=41117 RepID=UPI0018851810|nr:uncharacterized protein LOC119111776 [Pollicipes pollicipes]